MTGSYPIEIEINGEHWRLLVDPIRTLLEVLRDDLALTGAKRGCDQGVCGSCTVLRDGQPIRSCLALAVTLSGSRIMTIEADEPVLNIVRQSFVEAGAIQCGFCSPGLIVSASALL